MSGAGDQVRLEQSFYLREATAVAPDILGKVLVHEVGEERTAGLIVETEAYMGAEDRASHSFGGLRTKRNEALFGPAGHAYVYLIYGMYYCFNIVVGTPGHHGGVLVRSLQPVEGLDIMAARRGLDFRRKGTITRLANGPSKLCIAMSIDGRSNGVDLSDSELFIKMSDEQVDQEIVSGPRINIDSSGDARHFPWRFAVKGSRYLSRKV